MKWIYPDRIEVMLDADGNPTEPITEEDREKQRMLREEEKQEPLLIYKEPDNVYEETLVGICEEYGFDLNNLTEIDDTPVKVQFAGNIKTMPRWKAYEFARKLSKLGFAPIIDGVFCK